MSGGRPSIYTPELGAKLCELVRAGLPLVKAAEHEGLTYETLRAWGKKNAEFSVALKKARGESTKQSLDKIRAGVPGWQGEAWYLERSDPKNWGRRLEVKQDPKPPKAEPETEEQLWAKVAELQKRKDEQKERQH